MVRFKRLMMGVLTAAVLLAPVSAQASIRGTVEDFLDQITAFANPSAVEPPPSDIVRPVSHVTPRNTLASVIIPEIQMPSVGVPELPAPRIETPLKKFFCAEYARVRSGMAVFGDAKLWWSRAKNIYARVHAPAEQSVMVFTATQRLKLGHVAVVTHIVSSREIRVDQANWENHGEIDHATPVVDVSKKNDWSQVRVWNMKSATYGRIYPITGFIAKQLVHQASAQ